MIKGIASFRANFFAGLAVILPLVATWFIVQFLVLKTNDLILVPLTTFFEPFLKASSLILAKMIVFLCVLLFIVGIGAGTRFILLRRVFGLGEKFLYRLPFVNRVYRAIKQISNAFLGEGKGMFKSVALVQYPRAGIYSIGFITTRTKEGIDKKTETPTLSVFVPTTPNPTSGMLVMVPKKDVIHLDMSVEDGMKLVVSGGVVTP